MGALLAIDRTVRHRFYVIFMKGSGSHCLQIGSVAQVANKFRFSYPGYSELLTGTPQDAINTNDFGQNVFPTICEYIKERFQLDYNQVAVFASWRNLKDVSGEYSSTCHGYNAGSVYRLQSGRKAQ